MHVVSYGTTRSPSTPERPFVFPALANRPQKLQLYIIPQIIRPRVECQYLHRSQDIVCISQITVQTFTVFLLFRQKRQTQAFEYFLQLCRFKLDVYGVAEGDLTP